MRKHCTLCHETVEWCAECNVIKPHICNTWIWNQPVTIPNLFPTFTNGYTCLICNQWVFYNTYHSCGGTYTGVINCKVNG